MHTCPALPLPFGCSNMHAMPKAVGCSNMQCDAEGCWVQQHAMQCPRPVAPMHMCDWGRWVTFGGGGRAVRNVWLALHLPTWSGTGEARGCPCTHSSSNGRAVGCASQPLAPISSPPGPGPPWRRVLPHMPPMPARIRGLEAVNRVLQVGGPTGRCDWRRWRSGLACTRASLPLPRPRPPDAAAAPACPCAPVPARASVCARACARLQLIWRWLLF